MDAAVRVMMVFRFLTVAMGDQVFDVRKRVLDAALKYVRRRVNAFLLRHLCGQLRGFHGALALQRARLDHFAAQRRAQLLQIDLVAVLAGNVDHVQRDHHRDAQLAQLRRQIQVALDVGGVHDVQNRVRLILDQIAARHNFFQRVRRQAVNARQVLNDNVLFALQAAFLLFNGNARPVADVLVRSGQVVEHCGFATVRVACQRNLDCH